ncbi:primary replicative DNA helicase [Carboxydocella sporoproducens DSM 16521]|uniref:Replicative DNA helicase n=2 Tax=Carboxydocella TaxID=178898 RepID=A0A1T4SBY8_9FIRM|nr:primary replicative DNA helicase [Carboxydocella thermautotrophica]AVX32265.1 primary replicative DNA helicase [Carboxydocella thermautotrophica]SKA25743.1 primary replicative DNA helicase [Carboxydocella sporoproducens DSM 16521]
MSLAMDRVPPHNLDAEQSVLGSMLLDQEAVFKAMEIIRAEDFYRDAHRLIFEAICDLADRSEPVDIITVAEELRQRGQLDKVGGAAYIATLSGIVPTAANVEYYARIIREKSLLRALISAATRIAQLGYEGEAEAEEILMQAEKMIYDLSQRKASRTFATMHEILMETFDRIEYLYQNKGDVTGVPTGFIDLDRLTSGLQPSDLIIVAARPAMGKTSFCLNIAQHAAIKAGIPVAIFSLEMSREQLVQRMLCSEAMVDQHRLRTGQLTEQDWPRLVRAVGPMAQAPIFIDDTVGISVLEMRAKCRRLKAEHGLGLVIIDYLQLMQGSRRSESRQQEISEISRALKGLARELNVPVIALSQLSRAVEQTHDKRPNLSHLRESGAIEQDADIVSFIYREEYYNPDTEKKGIAEIIIAKHRNGPVGSVELGFLNEFTKFVNLERQGA